MFERDEKRSKGEVQYIYDEDLNLTLEIEEGSDGIGISVFKTDDLEDNYGVADSIGFVQVSKFRQLEPLNILDVVRTRCGYAVRNLQHVDGQIWGAYYNGTCSMWIHHQWTPTGLYNNAPGSQLNLVEN